jgi:hypothetical protein
MIEGMGDQVINIPHDQVRLLGKLPKDVVTVRWLGVPLSMDAFIYPDLIYLHIRHRFCFRHTPGCALCNESLRDFLDRYDQLLATEQEGE